MCAVRLEPPGMDLDSAYVRPLFLPSPLEELEEGEACQVAGWGRSDLTVIWKLLFQERHSKKFSM